MHFDYVFAGAGLQTALAVLALAARRPGAKVAVVEREARALGNHTWCWHAGDVPDVARPWLEPAIAQRWAGYRVRFPAFDRALAHSYSALTVESLGGAFTRALECLDAHLFFGHEVRELGARSLALDDGSTLTGALVVDARGPQPCGDAVGYQRFVGHELVLHAPIPSGLSLPILMDARVTQHDGFRFMYVLPLARDRVLVEDTCYARSPQLDTTAMSARVLAYAAELGLSVAGIARTEQGVLPLPGRVPVGAEPSDAALAAGYRGGWFHPVTGYSLPCAVRLALHLAEHGPDGARGPALDALRAEHERQARFLVLLNRLLFGAVGDDAKRNVFERFYRLPAATIARFYALGLTPWDRARIVCGRPPRGLSLCDAAGHAFRRPARRLS